MKKRQRGNGDGSITKLAGKRRKPYAVRITTGFKSDGTQKRSYLGYYKTVTEAKRALNEYLVNPFDLNKITTIEIFNKWVKGSKYTEEVLNNYRRVIENSGLSKKIFKDIKLMHLEDAASELTPAMQKRYKAAWKNLYLYAMKNDIVNKNLADIMDVDEYIAGERGVISTTDVKRILDGEEDIPKILLYTGLRISELLEIKSENVNLAEKIMIGGKKTKNGKNRRIPIHNAILPLIEKFMANGNEYLITDKNNKKIKYDDYLTNYWHGNKILTRYTPHYTRHTFVSRSVKLGLDRGVLQRVIGHSNKDATDIYTHLDLDQLRDFIDDFYYD